MLQSPVATLSPHTRCCHGHFDAHDGRFGEDRLTVTWGDSTATLPAFATQHKDVKCDIVVSLPNSHAWNVLAFSFQWTPASHDVLLRCCGGHTFLWCSWWMEVTRHQWRLLTWTTCVCWHMKALLSFWTMRSPYVACCAAASRVVVNRCVLTHDGCCFGCRSLVLFGPVILAGR